MSLRQQIRILERCNERKKERKKKKAKEKQGQMSSKPLLPQTEGRSASPLGVPFYGDGSPNADGPGSGSNRITRANSWSSPGALMGHPAGPNQVVPGSGVGEMLGVKFIGYYPDLQPLIRSRSFNGLSSLAEYTSPQHEKSPPPTPLLSMLSTKEWLREGSVRGSVFNLCSATLGAGALALPFAFSRCGWALGSSSSSSEPWRRHFPSTYS